MPSPVRSPANLRAIAGTLRPDRVEPAPVVQFDPIAEPPPAPDWLPNAHAVKEWDRLTRILASNRLLTEAALSALAMLCALHGRIVQEFAAGHTPTANMIGQYRALVNDFGLPPAAQSKIRAPASADGKPGNKFEKFKRGA
jgi:phage terminase small subunit